MYLLYFKSATIKKNTKTVSKCTFFLNETSDTHTIHYYILINNNFSNFYRAIIVQLINFKIS